MTGESVTPAQNNIYRIQLFNAISTLLVTSLVLFHMPSMYILALYSGALNRGKFNVPGNEAMYIPALLPI